MKNANLAAAARAKKDEFYTQLEDIENELNHNDYRNFFRGKIILCNCDDPYESEFFKYFAINFNALELKKLIVTCYSGSPISGTELVLPGFEEFYSKPRNEIAYKVELNALKDWNGDGREDLLDVKQFIESHPEIITPLEGNGDFRSAECIEFLKEADVVVTNPPFSLFREYVAQLMQYKKSFAILGPLNAITYKEIFPFIQSNKMWLGYGFHGKDPTFKVPANYEEREYRFWIDETGQKWRSFGNMTWYTNIPLRKYKEELSMEIEYSPELYPKYDNYDAIEVSKTARIPGDYFGVMGVPITFLDKYNPEQFEIVGKIDSGKIDEYNLGNPVINGKNLYKRLAIRRRQPTP